MFVSCFTAVSNRIELSNNVWKNITDLRDRETKRTVCSLCPSSWNFEEAFIWWSESSCRNFIVNERCEEHRLAVLTDFDILKLILRPTGSQWSEDSTERMSSQRHVQVLRNERLFCASCSLCKFAFDVPISSQLKWANSVSKRWNLQQISRGWLLWNHGCVVVPLRGSK